MQFAKLVPELYVSDLTRSLRFYVDILGFEVLFDRPEEKFAYLEREGAQIMLDQSTSRRLVAGVAAFPFGRGVSLQIEVEDVDALYT